MEQRATPPLADSAQGGLFGAKPPSQAVDGEQAFAERGLAAGLLVAVAVATLCGTAFFVWRTGFNGHTPDFPWLWRAGQHILDTGQVPAGDLFSWTRHGDPWVLYQWLFEVLIAQGEAMFGLRGLFALFTLAAIAVYLLAPLYGAVPRQVSPAFVALPAAMGLAVASVNLSFRPMMVTSAFLLIQYLLIQRLRRGAAGLQATVVAFLPLYVLWGNMHTGVTLGLLSLGLFAAGDLLERRGLYGFAPSDPGIEGRPAAPSRYLPLIAAAVLASLVNPYGFGIYEYIIDLSRQSYLNDLIQELRSPNFHELRLQWFLLFVAALLFFLTRTHRVFAAGDLLHLAVFTGAMLHSARFIVWAVLFYVLVLPRAIHHEWIASLRKQGDRPGSLPFPDRLARAGMAAPAALMPFVFWFAIAENVDGDLCDAARPAIVAYLAARLPEDRLFNDPGSGSCTLTEDPRQRVFIDTRFDFYGTDFVRDAIETLRMTPGWRQTLDRWRIDAMIIDRSWPLAQALAADPAYLTVFADENTVVLRRRPEPAPDQDRAAR